MNSRSPTIIRVFEHGRLRVGEYGFEEEHFNRLAVYNECHKNRYFELGHRSIRFGSYVGVLQVGSIVLEVLPKADLSAAPSETKWRDALIAMLRVCRLIPVHDWGDAAQRLRRANLLDLFFTVFLAEVRTLVRDGLTKGYRVEEANRAALRGRLMFQRHLSQNRIHKERFFTRSTTYDRDTGLNQILRQALIVLHRSASTSVRAIAGRRLLDFEGVSDQTVRARDFNRIDYDRNTKRYLPAVRIAQLILLNQMPDLRGGTNDVLAILFDMNELFEEFVFRCMRRSAAHRSDLEVHRQVSRRFWESPLGTKTLRPDIVVERRSKGSIERIVLDTKWKIPRPGSPGDDDLRQMYAYLLQFEARQAVLLYPKANGVSNVEGGFRRSGFVQSDVPQRCALWYLGLFDECNRLRSDLGENILNELCVPPTFAAVQGAT